DKYLRKTPFVLPGAGGARPPHPASPPSPPRGEGHRAESSQSGPEGRMRGASPHQPGAVKYTCPMHPEVVSDGPGDCPICGMALEPVVASLDDAPNPELKDFTLRLVVSAVLSVPILLL